MDGSWMSSRIAKIILLVEDRRHDSLLRKFLRRAGYDLTGLRTQMVNGKGSGEMYVRERYAAEVRAIRDQLTRTRASLIVMIDADTHTTADRRGQLERALRDADMEPRKESEPILGIVPRRHVETWILNLCGDPTDEQTNYRYDHRVNEERIKQAAKSLWDWSRPNSVPPSICVASLAESIQELSRLPPP